MTLTADTPQHTDVERFSDILVAQRAAYLRDWAPPLAARRSDLKKFKAALLARRNDIEEVVLGAGRPQYCVSANSSGFLLVRS